MGLEARLAADSSGADVGLEARPGNDEVVVEIAVPRTEADRAVVRLRDSGHRVLRVRDHAVPADADREAR